MKNLQLKKIDIFKSKNSIYLILGLQKGRPSYRRSPQLSKENIQNLKTWKFFTFFLFLWVIFTLPDPEIPDPIRIRNTAVQYSSVWSVIVWRNNSTVAHVLTDEMARNWIRFFITFKANSTWRLRFVESIGRGHLSGIFRRKWIPRRLKAIPCRAEGPMVAWIFHSRFIYTVYFIFMDRRPVLCTLQIAVDF